MCTPFVGAFGCIGGRFVCVVFVGITSDEIAVTDGRAFSAASPQGKASTKIYQIALRIVPAVKEHHLLPASAAVVRDPRGVRSRFVKMAASCGRRVAPAFP